MTDRRISYEILLELPFIEQLDEAIAIARDLSQKFAVNVTVSQLEHGETFADADTRTILTTVEPAP